mmetsp:Transcript_76159/g.168228  ORF Transcript_76159/g.168228 Transcript_76159/m.168228 type:complete len:558 (-) Transcript_76159:138-1811(-)
MLGSLALGGLVHLGILHELLVLGLGRFLRSLRLRLQPREVASDDLHHAKNTAALSAHSGVRFREGLGHGFRGLRLQEGGGCTCLGVELFQDLKGLSNSLLRLLGIPHGVSVLLLLLLADFGGVGHGSGQLGQLLVQGHGLLTQLGDGRAQLLDLRLQGVHLVSLLFPHGFVTRQLCLAPAVLGGLLIRLVLHLHNQLFDHRLHLSNGIRRSSLRRGRQHAALQRFRALLEEAGDLLQLLRARREGPEEGQGCGRLHQAGQVLLRTASHGAAADDVLGLGEGLKLLFPQLLALIEGGSLLTTGGLEILGIFLIRGLFSLRLVQIPFCRGLSLKLLGLELDFGILILLGLRQLRIQALHQHLIAVPLLGLFLFQAHALVHKLVLQALEHADHTAGLELVGLGFRGRLNQTAALDIGVQAVSGRDGQSLQVTHGLQLQETAGLLLGLQDLQGTPHRINGLGVVLQGRHKVAPRRLPELRGVLLLLAGRLDVRRVAADLLRQAGCFRGRRLDLRLQGFDLIRRRGNRGAFLGQSSFAEFFELGILHLLLVHFFGAFLLHGL